MFCKLYNLSFKVVCQYLLSKETYDIFEKYNCFEVIDELNNNRCVNPCDSIDLSSFFKNFKITRIIKDGKEVVFDETPCTCMLIVDYSSEDLDKFSEKILMYNEKYLMDGDFIFEFYCGQKKDDFVLCGYKEDDSYDIEEIKEILEKCDGVKI